MFPYIRVDTNKVLKLDKIFSEFIILLTLDDEVVDRVDKTSFWG